MKDPIEIQVGVVCLEYRHTHTRIYTTTHAMYYFQKQKSIVTVVALAF